MGEGKGCRKYGERNRILRGMGYADYAEYLLSDLWRKIRAAVLADRPACEVCDEPASLVHHAKYTRSALESTKSPGLVAMCHGCHYTVEFDAAGSKTSWSHANTRLLCLLTRSGKVDRAAVVARSIGRAYRPGWYSGGFDRAADGVRGRSKPRAFRKRRK